MYCHEPQHSVHRLARAAYACGLTRPFFLSARARTSDTLLSQTSPTAVDHAYCAHDCSGFSLCVTIRLIYAVIVDDPASGRVCEALPECLALTVCLQKRVLCDMAEQAHAFSYF